MQGQAPAPEEKILNMSLEKTNPLRLKFWLPKGGQLSNANTGANSPSPGHLNHLDLTFYGSVVNYSLFWLVIRGWSRWRRPSLK